MSSLKKGVLRPYKRNMTTTSADVLFSTTTVPPMSTTTMSSTKAKEVMSGSLNNPEGLPTTTADLLSTVVSNLMTTTIELTTTELVSSTSEETSTWSSMVPGQPLNASFQNQTTSQSNAVANESAGGFLDTFVQMGGLGSDGSGVFLYSLQVILVLWTIMANLMAIGVIWSDRRLHHNFFYILANMAVVDLNVGLSVLSIFTLYNFSGRFPLGAFMCGYWIWNDYLMSLEAAFVIAALCYDTFYSMLYPLIYKKQQTGRRCVLLMVLTWCFSLILWIPAFSYDRTNNTYPMGECEWSVRKNSGWAVYLGFVGYYPTLAGILAGPLYYFWVQRKRQRQISARAAKERTIDQSPKDTSNTGQLVLGKGSQTPLWLFIWINVFFVFCRMWYYFYFLEGSYTPGSFTDSYKRFSYWMLYINSAINPILYLALGQHFRLGLKRFLRI